jgi:hypothetical protein
MGYRNNLHDSMLQPIDDEVCANWPEKNGSLCKIFTFMPQAWSEREAIESLKELIYPAVRRIDVVLRDEFPNRREVQSGVAAQDIRTHLRDFPETVRFVLDACLNFRGIGLATSIELV